MTTDAAPDNDNRFALTLAWPQTAPGDAVDLLAFWAQHNAIPDPDEARARLAQVVLLARDAEGSIAGVCTAYPMTPPQLEQPMYFLRAFIAPQWRTTRLAGKGLSTACDVLGQYSRAHDFPCIGILLELENARFRQVGRKAEWVHPRFTYIGKSPRGLDVRVHYFRGAKLK